MNTNTAVIPKVAFAKAIQIMQRYKQAYSPNNWDGQMKLERAFVSLWEEVDPNDQLSEADMRKVWKWAYGKVFTN
jgi:hypothetical protein